MIHARACKLIGKIEINFIKEEKKQSKKDKKTINIKKEKSETLLQSLQRSALEGASSFFTQIAIFVV